jgi:hypothetical protein
MSCCNRLLCAQDFERTLRPPPAPTLEAAAALEDVIKSRILELRFDNVVRVALPGTSNARARPEVALVDTKAKEGLAEEYARTVAGTVVDRHASMRAVRLCMHAPNALCSVRLLLQCGRDTWGPRLRRALLDSAFVLCPLSKLRGACSAAQHALFALSAAPVNLMPAQHALLALCAAPLNVIPAQHACTACTVFTDCSFLPAHGSGSMSAVPQHAWRAAAPARHNAAHALRRRATCRMHAMYASRVHILQHMCTAMQARTAVASLQLPQCTAATASRAPACMRNSFTCAYMHASQGACACGCPSCSPAHAAVLACTYSMHCAVHACCPPVGLHNVEEQGRVSVEDGDNAVLCMRRMHDQLCMPGLWIYSGALVHVPHA